MLETHQNGLSMWVPTLYEQSFEAKDLQHNFMATDDSASSILPQLLLYLQELDKDEDALHSSCPPLPTSDPSFCPLSASEESKRISFEGSWVDTQNIPSSSYDETSKHPQNDRYATPSQNRTSWFRSPVLQEFLDRHSQLDAEFEPSRYLGAPEIFPLSESSKRFRCTSADQELKIHELSPRLTFASSPFSTARRKLTDCRTGSSSARSRLQQPQHQVEEQAPSCKQFSTHDLSNLYKEAINKIATELKLKLKELNEKQDANAYTPTCYSTLSTRSRFPPATPTAPQPEQIQLPLQSKITGASHYSCNIIEQLYKKHHKVARSLARSTDSNGPLAKSVKVFQRRQPGQLLPVAQTLTSSQYIFLKMQEQNKQ